MFCEAIPCLCLQMYAILTRPEKAFVMILSVMMSTSTIAYPSALVSYDLDVHLTSRKSQPWNYGYILPSPKARVCAFMGMMIVSSTQVRKGRGRRS